MWNKKNLPGESLSEWKNLVMTEIDFYIWDVLLTNQTNLHIHFTLTRYQIRRRITRAFLPYIHVGSQVRDMVGGKESRQWTITILQWTLELNSDVSRCKKSSSHQIIHQDVKALHFKRKVYMKLEVKKHFWYWHQGY